MNYTIHYRMRGAITIQADTVENAKNEFDNMSKTYLAANCDDTEGTVVFDEDGNEVTE